MIKTRNFPVACGAYKALDQGAYLTHACEINADGFPVRVLCKRVRFESILDDTTQANDGLPSCKACARILKQLSKPLTLTKSSTGF